MHMLMDALGEQDEPILTESLRKAAAFLSQQHDRLAAGVWFLHDGLEHSIEAMREGPFRMLPSRALGKSEANMLVLNSHLDATVALDRYMEVTGDTQHQLLVVKAMSATRAVLSLRPAEWLYKPLFWTIRLTFLPRANAEKLPVHLKVLKRLAWKYLIPTLPHIKAPSALAMPGNIGEPSLRYRYEYSPSI
jgi:hypothetical protein